MSYTLTFRNIAGELVRVGEVLEYRTNSSGFRHAVVTDETHPQWRSAVPLYQLAATRSHQ